MSIEIHQPDLERRMLERVQSGEYHDVGELLTKALDALSESAGGRMGALDWSQCPAVESVPGKVSGAWVFKNTRMPVAAVFENLEDGVTIDELVELYDGLMRDHVKAVLDFRSPQPGSTRALPLMRILFDQGTPVPIAAYLREHTSMGSGWD